MSKKEEKIGIDEGLNRLDMILKRMEEPNIELAKSFELYEEGIILLKNVNEEIEKMEGKIQALSKEGIVMPFDEDPE